MFTYTYHAVPSPLEAAHPAQAQIAEVAAVAAHFPNPVGLAATGVTVAGIKYMFVNGSADETIQAKKVRMTPIPPLPPLPPLPPQHLLPPLTALARRRKPGVSRARYLCLQGSTGVVFYKCNTCIIVGTHDDKVTLANCLNTVSKLGDYLKAEGI